MRRCFILSAALLAFVGAADVRPPVAPVMVPYRLAPTRHVIVRAKIDGKGPFNLVLDTGAPMLVLAKKLQAQLGIPEGDGEWATLKRMEIEGGVVFENQTVRFDDLFQLEGMNGLGLAGLEIHGLAGYPILAKYRIEYDLNEPKLAWTKLDYKIAELPKRGTKAMKASSLNALGSAMKGIGTLLGMNKPVVTKLRPFLGMTVAEENGELTVKSVVPEGPVSNPECWVVVGSVLLEVGGVRVKTIAELDAASSKLKAGEKTTITYRFKEQSNTFPLTPREGF